jgi:hypothetical protein
LQQFAVLDQLVAELSALSPNFAEFPRLVGGELGGECSPALSPSLRFPSSREFSLRNFTTQKLPNLFRFCCCYAYPRLKLILLPKRLERFSNAVAEQKQFNVTKSSKDKNVQYIQSNPR